MQNNLSIEAIKNAAELVNSSLVSKGFITDELMFPVINWPQLIQDQPNKDDLAKIEITPTVYNNDKNVINIIYSLTQSIDRHQAQHKSFNRTITQKNATIDELRAKVHQLEQQVHNYEDRLDKTVHIDQISLTERVNELSRKTKVQALEVSRLKSHNAEIQTKYAVDMRKKSLEISKLKDKLLDSRSLSNTLSFGRPFLLTSRSSLGDRLESPEINTNVIYNNKPIIDNTKPLEEVSLTPVRDQEYDGIATQLSQLIENLIKENSKFANFVNELNGYFNKFNSQMSVLNYRKLGTSSLVNPSDEIDLNRIMKDTSTDVEPFEFISRPLLSNIYKNYHYVSGLVDMAVSNLDADSALDTLDWKKTIETLKEENQSLQKKWQEAIKALEDWKKYRHIK
ncbi:CIC11C00000001349 [Sungouiella intermedia]|uniref:CIC11C00000001349 n=1 Tax=Sungouiella intermedia TaxID=45354 RepID=A0A1L0BNF5_9ASCO|nr:CIC11C00000001349 [[Candida] intermedia]